MSTIPAEGEVSAEAPKHWARLDNPPMMWLAGILGTVYILALRWALKDKALAKKVEAMEAEKAAANAVSRHLRAVSGLEACPNRARCGELVMPDALQEIACSLPSVHLRRPLRLRRLRLSHPPALPLLRFRLARRRWLWPSSPPRPSTRQTHPHGRLRTRARGSTLRSWATTSSRSRLTPSTASCCSR